MWQSRGAERAGDGVPPWTRLEHLARYRFAASHIHGGTVLDCACGDGAGAAEYLRAHADIIVGFDLDSEAVAAARKAVTDPSVRFEVADATALPQPDDTVDLYISLETIEHIPDADAMLREVVRVLRPTGSLICSTPNRIVQNPGASLIDQPICQYHVREYAPREFVALLRPYFGSIMFYGQNDVGWLRQRYIQLVGLLPSRRAAARLSQIVKLTRLVVDNLDRHAVVPGQPGHLYDLSVAVCCDPLAQEASLR